MQVGLFIIKLALGHDVYIFITLTITHIHIIIIFYRSCWIHIDYLTDVDEYR